MADTLVHADSHAHGNHSVDPGPMRFTMPSSYRTVLFAGIVLGLVCLVLTYFSDPVDKANSSHLHSRFWSNLLHNGVFFMGISFMSLFLVAAKVLFYSGWHTVFKRVWEAYAQYLPIAILTLLPIVIGLFTHSHHLYHWADSSALETDKLLAGKSAFLNPIWYTVAAVGIVGIWYFLFAIPLRNQSLDEDKNGTSAYTQHRKMRKTAGIFLPIAAFSSAAVIWLLVMSVDAHWYSTLFAWYATASWLVSAVGLTILALIFLKHLGYYGQVTADHLHDLGKYMFAFSIFWTYLWFSQFMLIWYGNVGEETVYFQTRMDEFPVLFWANLLINFLIPFFVLMPNVTKRKYGTLVFVAIMVVFGHWLDYFQMLKPGVLETTVEASHHGGSHEEMATLDGGSTADAGMHAEGHHAAEGHGEGAHSDASAGDHGHGGSHFYAGFHFPGLLEVGVFLGYLCLFFLVGFGALSKANLVPANDPYLGESLHHHVV